MFLQSYPLSRSGNSAMEEGICQTVQIMESGFSVAISPEGTRTQIPLEQRVLHRGFAEIALRGGLPIIPVVLNGFDIVWPKGKPLKLLEGLHRHEVGVHFGTPIIVPKLDDQQQRREARIELTNNIKLLYHQMLEPYLSSS